ncbi:MAG TPA: zinc ribbon domain-containing protein [Gemmatimonadales bacterium]|nr:zinc ribbon domain-containing protein [Gemmatimonadales bacterium]
MTDLERFFRHLVNTIAANDPARLRQSLSVGDIRSSILPYRVHRRALQLESSEDYELLLMRLCAGEGGLAHTSPDQARTAFIDELSSPNPDLSLVELHTGASITLDHGAVARSLDHRPELAFAPPRESDAEAAYSESPRQAHPAAERRQSPLPAEQTPVPAGGCMRCGSALPQKRVVNFCPQCGYNLRPRRCRSCGLELEPAWRHCIGCGAAVTTLS